MGVSTFSIGQVVLTSFIPPLGPTTYVPSLVTLSQSDDTYKPIPVSVAIQQYLPAAGFKERMYYYQYPNRKPAHQFGDTTEQGFNGGHRTTELSSSVFTTRSAFKPGKTVTYTHTLKVVLDKPSDRAARRPDRREVTQPTAKSKKVNVPSRAGHSRPRRQEEVKRAVSQSPTNKTPAVPTPRDGGRLAFYRGRIPSRGEPPADGGQFFTGDIEQVSRRISGSKVRLPTH